MKFYNTEYQVKIQKEKSDQSLTDSVQKQISDNIERNNRQRLSPSRQQLQNEQLNSDDLRFSTFERLLQQSKNDNIKQGGGEVRKSLKVNRTKIKLEVEDLARLTDEQGCEKLQQSGNILISNRSLVKKGRTELRISNDTHTAFSPMNITKSQSPAANSKFPRHSNSSLSDNNNNNGNNHYFLRRASNININNLQRNRQANKMTKIIKDHYNRDHSEASDLNSIDSFETGTDSVASKQKSEFKHKIRVTNLGSNVTEQLDNFLFDSVFRNDVQKIKDYINGFPTQFEKLKKLNSRDKQKRTPLFYALYHNNYEMINYLLNQGADTLYEDETGKTALHYACIIGVSKPILKLLLDFNNKFDFTNSHTEEAYHQYENRLPSKYDVPPKRQRQRGSIIPSLGLPTLNLENIKTGQRHVSIMQPNTSLLPKKGRQLDPLKVDLLSNKKLQIKDDAYDPNKLGLKHIQEDLNSDQSSSQYSSRLQSVAVAHSKPNQLLQRRKTIRMQQNTQFMSGHLLKQNNLNPGANQAPDDHLIKEDEERKIKKLKQYQSQAKKFVNLTDNKGKTALHFACFKGHIQLVQTLIKYNAIPLIRDHKGRKPIELTDEIELKDLMSKEETMFEEKFSANSSNLRKSLVLDDFEKLRAITNSHLGVKSNEKNVKGKLMSKTEEIKESMNESDLNSTIVMQKLEQKDTKKSFNQRMSRRMQFNKKELASMSDKQLSKFCIGIYKDNALTYKIRFEDKENFQYLLQRQISVLNIDQNGNNVIHYAIQLEKLEFLSYLIEGKFDSEIMKMCETGTQSLNDQFTHKAAKEICETIRTGTFQWIPEALQALEKSNFKEGNTCLHLAIDIGNLQIFNYIVTMLKVRDHMRGLDKNKFWNMFKLSNEVQEFKNKIENTPLLFSAKRNQTQMFEILIQNGCHIYTQCNKFMNVLHYAVLNENQSLIQQIVYADAESDRLLKEKNFRDETPFMLDDKSKYENIFHHIWEAASIQSTIMIERLDWFIKTEKYECNQKTLIGQNSPLHFAVIYENLKAIELLCKQSDISIHQRNSLGQSPCDLAFLIPKKKISLKIIDYLQKKSVSSQQFGNQTLSPTPIILNKGLTTNTFNIDNNSLTKAKHSQILINQKHSQASSAMNILENVNNQNTLPSGLKNNLKPQMTIGNSSSNNNSSPNTRRALNNKNLRITLEKAAPLKHFHSEIFDQQQNILVQNLLTMHPGIFSNPSLSVQKRNSSPMSHSSDESDRDTSRILSNSQPSLTKGQSSKTLVDDAIKRNNSTWDTIYIEKFLSIYDIYIDNKDMIGMFSVEIFNKWRSQLLRSDDTRKAEIRDCFKQFDAKKRGVIKWNDIKEKLQLLDCLFAIDNEKSKFIEHIERYYSDTKISEEVFLKLILSNSLSK
eukprot:403345605